MEPQEDGSQVDNYLGRSANPQVLTRHHRTSLTEKLTVSVVAPETVVIPEGISEMTAVAVQSIEDLMQIPLPNNHVIIVLDEHSLPLNWAQGVNYGYAVAIRPDPYWTHHTLQHLLNHEIAHYWWTGSEEWIDEGIAQTLAVSATSSQGTGTPLTISGSCSAKNLSQVAFSHIDARETRTEENYLCSILLGKDLFQALQGAMTPEEFTASLQSLHQAGNRVPSGLTILHIKTRIEDVRRAFPFHQYLVEEHYNGNPGS